jgi:hypothetical protein
VGTNVQRRLAALHHLNPPWRPADLEQREGRIVRQGNLNPKVRVIRYVQQESFDAYSWQTLERKVRFITQLQRLDPSMREMEDLADDVVDYARVKLAALGDPLAVEEYELGQQVRKLANLREAFASEQGRRAMRATQARQTIGLSREVATRIEGFAKTMPDARGDKFSWTMPDGQTLTKRAEASEAVHKLIVETLRSPGGHVHRGTGMRAPRPLGLGHLVGQPAHFVYEREATYLTVERGEYRALEGRIEMGEGVVHVLWRSDTEPEAALQSIEYAVRQDVMAKEARRLRA